MSDEDEVERLLPVSVVADLLGTGRDYVYSRIKAGEFGNVVELGDEKPKQRIKISAYKEFVRAREFGGVSS